jgi:hypothetical protein
MAAYLLLLVAVLSRLLPHAGWFNFTAVGGALLFFGARRSWREMLAPLAVLIAADYYLTVYAYHYRFQWQAYLPTWAWYGMAMVLGQILLHARTTFVRVAAGTLLGPTSFFGLELCGLGWRRNVSAHAGRAGRLLCGGFAVLSQRPDLDGDCCRAGVWGSGAGAADESGVGTGCAGGEVGLRQRKVSSRCAGLAGLAPLRGVSGVSKIASWRVRGMPAACVVRAEH